MNFCYPIKITKTIDGKGFMAQSVDIPEVTAVGLTLDETIQTVQEKLSEELAQRICDNITLPLPSETGGEEVYSVTPSVQVQATALIAHHREKAGITMAELARRLETSWASAKKLEQPNHLPTLRTMEKAAESLGMQLILNFTPKKTGR